MRIESRTFSVNILGPCPSGWVVGGHLPLFHQFSSELWCGGSAVVLWVPRYYVGLHLKYVRGDVAFFFFEEMRRLHVDLVTCCMFRYSTQLNLIQDHVHRGQFKVPPIHKDD